MKITRLIFFLCVCTTFSLFSQKDITVANISEYNKAIKSATPGTNIILKNGIWKDVFLKAFGTGTKEKPIVIKAEKAGQVIISGNSKLQIYGEHIIVQGLWFKDGKPTSKSIVSFRKNAEEFANNCRFTHNTISYYNPEDPNLKSHWVDLWGKNNRVDHNNFTGKTNEGTTLVVWLKGDAHTENNHSIDTNFFGPRPELGKNGGETIRIGTSANSMKSSKTVVENNTFKKCDGEIEIISNKSGDNIYRNNLFLSSQGALTLRHGDNALVENNVFIGNDVPKTGGIRVINEGHIIRNNLMVGLKGKGYRSPLTIMYGVPNSPLNRYKQVKNVNIQNNTLINCSTMEFGTGKDKEKTLAPVNSIFANNLITNTNNTKVLHSSNDISGIFFMNNIVETTADFDDILFKKQVIDWKSLRSLPMPSNTNEGLVSNYKDSKTPKEDITKSERTPFVVGAFNLDNTKYPRALTVKAGPYWKPDIITPKTITKTKEVTVKPGNNTLSQVIKKATNGTIINLEDGIYTLEKEQKINTNITIIGTENTIIQSNKNIKPFKSFFKISEGTNLVLKNLNFEGKTNNMKYAVISPSSNDSEPYNLFIDNCTFKGFKNKQGAIIKSYANTLADTISIKNSKILDSFRGLNLYSKENALGKVNVSTIILDNTVFKNITEYAIKYYVRYYQERVLTNSNIGNLQVSNCIFSNVDNREKGKIIMVKDIANINIKNSVFEKSINTQHIIHLSGPKNKITNCLVSGTGKIKTDKGALQKRIFFKNPKWENSKEFIPSEKSILLKENNKSETIGLIR